MAKRKRLAPAHHIPDPGETDHAIDPVGTIEPRRVPIGDVVGDVAARAALADMSHTLETARRSGRLVLELPLEQIDTGYLVRDRVELNPDEMAALGESIRARGQQTPIDVVRLGPDRFGLISGWRRLQALRQLAREPGGERFVTVLAFERRPDQAADAYLAMVEENEIRVGLSHYERARIALKAVEQGVYPDSKAALLALFAQASRSKRSKIRSFLALVAALDGHLTHPGAIGERLGLALSKALERDPDLAERLCDALRQAAPVTSAEAETALLEATLRRGRPTAAPPPETEKGAQTIRPGLTLQRQGDGTIVLKGPALTAALHDRLVAFLRECD